MNFERFLGYASTYDEGRPEVPNLLFEILKVYKDTIDTIVDIGCGTGLSTNVCTSYAKNVIGIEPSDDMLKVAKTKEKEGLEFRLGFGEDTKLDDCIADIVIISQAFHWMESSKTIKEVYRILKPGGIFAIVDAIYPPIINLELEKINNSLLEKTRSFETVKIDKSKHFEKLNESKLFKNTRQIYLSKNEKYDKERFKKYLLSQSTVQMAIKNNFEDIKDELELLDSKLDNIFKGNSLDAFYSYVVNIGIK